MGSCTSFIKQAQALWNKIALIRKSFPRGVNIYFYWTLTAFSISVLSALQKESLRQSKCSG